MVSQLLTVPTTSTGPAPTATWRAVAASVADKLTGRALTGLGLTAFGAEGDEFDPSLHEAMQHEGDGSNPVIGTVMRQGYKLGEQVLRHAPWSWWSTPSTMRRPSPDTPANGEQSGSQNAESDFRNRDNGEEVTRHGSTRMGREGLLQGARRLL